MDVANLRVPVLLLMGALLSQPGLEPESFYVDS